MIRTILAVMFILAALAWASSGDFRDETQDLKIYCSRVFGDNPIWPDYKNMGIESCGEVLR